MTFYGSLCVMFVYHVKLKSRWNSSFRCNHFVFNLAVKFRVLIPFINHTPVIFLSRCKVSFDVGLLTFLEIKPVHEHFVISSINAMLPAIGRFRRPVR